MKIILALILLFVVQFFEIDRAEALCYQMASYVKPKPGDTSFSAQTPLFDLQIFNRKDGCFPIATREGADGSGGVEQTGFTSYSNGIQFLFDLMIGISIALAVILFTWGAAQGILGDVIGKDRTGIDEAAGKKTMKDALVGLLIILGMWLVVNTINPDLLKLPALQGLYKLNSTGKESVGPSGVGGRAGS